MQDARTLTTFIVRHKNEIILLSNKIRNTNNDI